MKKTVYIVYDVPRKDSGDEFQGTPTYDREKAIQDARYWWWHLTPGEQKQREIYVGVHTVNVPDDDQRDAEQLYRDLMDEDEWTYDHDVIEIDAEKPIEIQFEAGTGIHFSDGVNLLTTLQGSPLKIYAECPVPDDASDDYGYLTLKKAVLAEMAKRGLGTDSLVFWYDGQENLLEQDAAAECDVYVQIG